jgi:multidrug efflux pump subunit AcrA (membrane-fusion protein)
VELENFVAAITLAIAALTGDQGCVAKQRAITLGDTTGNDYAVTGGLKAGEKVIISGTQFLNDGAPVQPL